MDTHSGEERNRSMVSLSSTNYSYMDTFAPNSQEIYNFANGMENMINPHSATWKEFFSSGGASSSKGPPTSNEGFYPFNPENTNESMLPAPQDHNTYVDDSSLRCVFPCEGNEKPSQGLSLSLSSTNPSTIGLQSFELRLPSDQGFYQKSMDHIQQGNHDHSMILQEGYLGKPAHLGYPNGYFHIQASKYLGPVQELLNEFCNLERKEKGPKGPKLKTRELDNSIPSSSGTFLDLQKNKVKLLAMLEEVTVRPQYILKWPQRQCQGIFGV